MAPDNPAERSLSVDFDEITKIFQDLRPVIAEITDIHDFVSLMQTATQKIFLKYFESTNSRLYKVDDLRFLEQHVMDCINSVTPNHIPYKSVSVDGKWRLYPIENDDKSNKSKPN